ncbi:MAG: hypothetical protein HGA76_12255, partial [Candidatus Firestonebacteria bacterium]|nr:hypothetical protein [Candidatus Firestonebacteria bacterium]
LEHLRYTWFKFIFYTVLFITLVQVILLFPTHQILIDKSHDVKEVLASSELKKFPLLAYNIPPNAPAFYFTTPVAWAGDWPQMDAFVLQHHDAYLLFRQDAFQPIQTHFQGRSKFCIVSSSANQELYLGLVSKLDH